VCAPPNGPEEPTRFPSLKKNWEDIKMRIYTICHQKDVYTIHLGTDLFYSYVAEARTYDKAVAHAKALAGINGKVFYTEGLFQPKVEI
jgi:hypothetical protein